MNKKKIVNIKVLEPLIQNGIIKISPFVDTLLCATFFPKNGDSPISQRSDRGVKHLLVSLAAEWSYVYSGVKMKMLDDVNLAYAYPASIARPSILLNFLRQSSTVITYADTRYKVVAEQHAVPHLAVIAGRYVKTGEGATLQKAFGAAIVADAVLIM